jgi:hypothetical protein
MAELRHPIEKDQHPDVEGTCQVCGNRRTESYWMGRGVTIEVCTTCAIETLPLLTADALHDLSLSNQAAVQAVVDRMTGAFWRGVAIRLIRREKQRRDEHEERARLAGSEMDDESQE